MANNNQLRRPTLLTPPQLSHSYSTLVSAWRLIIENCESKNQLCDTFVAFPRMPIYFLHDFPTFELSSAPAVKRVREFVAWAFFHKLPICQFVYFHVCNYICPIIRPLKLHIELSSTAWALDNEPDRKSMKHVTRTFNANFMSKLDFCVGPAAQRDTVDFNCWKLQSKIESKCFSRWPRRGPFARESGPEYH